MERKSKKMMLENSIQGLTSANFYILVSALIGRAATSGWGYLGYRYSYAGGSDTDIYDRIQDNSSSVRMLADYVNTKTFYNPHIMFIAKKNLVKEWFDTLFPWLERCEKIFGFTNLKGYDTTRIYAYLAERYLSYWFQKNTKYTYHPWKFMEKF